MRIVETFPDINSQLTKQVVRGTLILCSAVSSAFAALSQLDNRKMGNVLKKRRVSTASPEVIARPLPQSAYPTNGFSFPFSSANLFSDSDSGGFIVEAIEEGKMTLPNWLSLNEGELKLKGTFNTFASSAHVVGNLAYLANPDLQIIDISNPFSPTQVGSYYTAREVYVVNNLAYVATSSLLHILNVTDPSAPTVLSNSLSSWGSPYNMHVENNRLYTVTTSNFLIFDISNPFAPTLASRYDTPGNSRGMHVVENMAYISSMNNGMQILNVTNSSAPIFVSNYLTPTSALDVFVVSNVAYVADSSYGLQIIDVSNPSSPMLISSLAVGTSSLFVAGGMAYLVQNAAGLQMVDVNNPSSPALVGSYAPLEFPESIQAIGNRVYLIDNLLGLVILERESILSGTPDSVDIGNYEIEIITKDPEENQVSLTFTVRVEGLPTVSGSIPSLLANVNTPFTYFIDQSVFQDPNGDIVFHSAKIIDQNPLPSWLSFSPIGIFSGTPKEADIGNYTLELSAFDGIIPRLVTTTFSLIVEQYPKVQSPIPNHAAEIDQLYNFTLPEGTFIDEDVSDLLTYTTSTLPTWLTFNSNSLLFSGVPTLGDAGTQVINLHATDLAGATASTSFRLEIENFPDLQNPIPDQLASVGYPFIYTVPANTFSSPNGDPLTYRAVRSNGDRLPNWLGFVGAKLEFKGTPASTDKGQLSLKLLAEDLKGGWIDNIFNLDVIDALSEESTRIQKSFTYTIPSNMINNPQGPVTYTVTLSDNTPLPTWLVFDPLTATISATPPINSEGNYNILINANDGVQTPSLGTVLLTIEANGGPKVANQISNQVAQVGQKYRFVVPDNTFIDPNSDPLTLSATRVDGRLLPGWLSFADRTLEGKPGPSHTGAFSDKTVPLKICATDGNLEDCTLFDLSVQGTSNEEKTLSILIPLFSIGTLGLGWYKKRGLVLNPLNREKYDKGTISAPLSTPFTYLFQADKSKIVQVIAYLGKEPLFGLPIPDGKWMEWPKVEKPIAGGALLPDWLTYDYGKNELESSFDPRDVDRGLYTIRAYGKGEMILEEVKLDVGGQSGKSVEMHQM